MSPITIKADIVYLEARMEGVWIRHGYEQTYRFEPKDCRTIIAIPLKQIPASDDENFIKEVRKILKTIKNNKNLDKELPVLLPINLPINSNTSEELKRASVLLGQESIKLLGFRGLIGEEGKRHYIEKVLGIGKINFFSSREIKDKTEDQLNEILKIHLAFQAYPIGDIFKHFKYIFNDQKITGELFANNSVYEKINKERLFKKYKKWYIEPINTARKTSFALGQFVNTHVTW